MIRNSTRRQFLTQATRIAALTVFSSSCKLERRHTSSRPNIVLILADDLGYGDISCYGCGDINTPVIDSMAANGVRFTNFYANAPQCTPTRAALMTGRYQNRVGGLECAIGEGNVGRYEDAIRLREKNELGLPVEETSIARLLKNSGYKTAICGKWHLGYESKFSPLKHGFDYAFGPIGAQFDYFHHCDSNGVPDLYLNGEPVQREEYLTDLITDEAAKFIRSRQDTPFFLYVPYNAPHAPYQGPDDRKPEPKSAKGWGSGTRETYVVMVESMDQGIGKIIKALDEKGFTERTLIIFTSDNGANKKGRNLPFSGYKSSLFEGGIRVPCIVKWPGVFQGGLVSDHISVTMDLSASIVRAAGTKPSEERPFDGIDILQNVEKKQASPKRTLFWRYRRGEQTWKAVRDGSMKYIYRKEGDDIQEYLFDLEQDPYEKINFFSKRSADVKRLKNLIVDWEREVQHIR